MSSPRRKSFVAVIVAVAVAAVAGTALGRTPVRAATQSKPFVAVDRMAGRDRMKAVGPEQPDTTIEPSIAVNPANPDNAVAVYQEGRVDAGGDATNGWATTFDGGRHWIYGELPGLTRGHGGDFDRASDAVVAFGPNNVVYANSLVFDDVTNNALRSGLTVNVSRDGGRTWGPPILLQDDQGGGLNDKNWIGVDTGTGPGHHPGRVYVVWDRIAPVLATYSDDQGKTWLPAPSVVYPGQGIGSIPLIMPNGDLGVVYVTDVAIAPTAHPTPGDELAEPIAGLSKIVVSVAAGAGSLPTGAPLVFTPPISVGVYDGNTVRQQRAGTLPTADVDPATGRIYVGWEDARFRTDGANDVVITSSDDGGVTWTPVKKVNLGAPDDQVDSYNPSLAAGPNGVLRVAYRVRQEAAAVQDFSPYVDTYFQRSLDGGATFTRPLRVNRVRTNVNFAAFSRNGAFLGDYNQIAIAGKRTYVVRCEAYPLSADEPSTFPPSVYHQRTWVAVLGGG